MLLAKDSSIRQEDILEITDCNRKYRTFLSNFIKLLISESFYTMQFSFKNWQWGEVSTGFLKYWVLKKFKILKKYFEKIESYKRKVLKNQIFKRNIMKKFKVLNERH